MCEAENGLEALHSLESHIVDVILMDVRMPVMDGLQATQKIHSKYPHVKVVILTTFNEDEYIFQGIRNGVSGYVLKDSNVDYIILSIKEAMQKGIVFDPDVTPKLIQAIQTSENRVQDSKQLSCLSKREKEIVQLIVQGKSNSEIASEIYLSEGTIKNVISTILKKLNLKRRTQIISLLTEYRG